MFALEYQNLKGENLYVSVDKTNLFLSSSQTYPVYNWNIVNEEKGLVIKYDKLYFWGSLLSTQPYYWNYDSKNNLLKNETKTAIFTPVTFKTKMGICNWSGLYKFTDNNLLQEGEKVLRNFKCFDTIKLYLGKRSSSTYKLPVSVDNMSLVEIAKLPYYNSIFKNHQFNNIILVCHSTHRKKSNYWNDDFTENDKKMECKEFHDLSTYLRTFTNKVFILQNWESDNYKRRTKDASDRMIQWIKARQSGVDVYRKELVKNYDVKKYPVVEFNDNVFHAIEVNRVKEANTITYEVLPYIRVDLISYSCYETQENSQHFHKAINIILSKIDRRRNYTGGSVPSCLSRFSSPLYIGEFGLSHTERSEEYILSVIKHLIRTANNYKLPIINFWNLYNNEKGRLFGLIDSNNELTSSGNFFKN